MIRDLGSIADRRAIEARVSDEYGDYVLTFVGPTIGLVPITVSMAILDGRGRGYDAVRVDSPERFGDTFGMEWVRNYVAPLGG